MTQRGRFLTEIFCRFFKVDHLEAMHLHTTQYPTASKWSTLTHWFGAKRKKAVQFFLHKIQNSGDHLTALPLYPITRAEKGQDDPHLLLANESAELENKSTVV